MRRFKSVVRQGVMRIVKSEPQSIVGNRYIAGKLFPLDPDGHYHVQPKPGTVRASGALPVPPLAMWEGYGRSPGEYLASGERHMAAMVDILARAGTRAATLQRVLDFGCAGGRLLRFYPQGAPGQELWGVDINAQYINWCQNNLPAPFLFATTTTLPHLPFEDNHFDLVYCGSVFTHVTDLADAWFLELRRVLRKGGLAYITIQDKTSLALMLARYRAAPPSADAIRSFVKIDGDPGTSPMGLHLVHEADRATNVGSLDFASFAFATDPYSNIFYDADFLAAKWSRFAEVVSVTPQAYGSQTALLCRKR